MTHNQTILLQGKHKNVN